MKEVAEEPTAAKQISALLGAGSSNQSDRMDMMLKIFGILTTPAGCDLVECDDAFASVVMSKTNQFIAEIPSLRVRFPYIRGKCDDLQTVLHTVRSMYGMHNN